MTRLATDPDAQSPAQQTRALWARRALMTLIALVVLLGLVGFWGVHSDTASAVGNGYTLTTRYAGTARPGLSVPFEVDVVHPGGFSGPVQLAVSSDYLSSVQATSPLPEPSDSTSEGDLVLLTFDPPAGDHLHVAWQASVDPAADAGRRHARVAVVDHGRELVSRSLRTWLWP